MFVTLWNHLSFTGIVDGRLGQSVYNPARKNQHIFCRPSVKKYFNNLILQGANILFAAKAMNGEEITREDKIRNLGYILENNKLFENECEKGMNFMRSKRQSSLE